MRIERVIPIVMVGFCLVVGATRVMAETGKSVSKEYSISDFDHVAIAGAIEFDIVQAKTFMVILTASDEKALSKVHVNKTGTTLTIERKSHWWWNDFNRTTIKAHIELPALQSIAAAGASHGTLLGINNYESLVVNMSGSSTMEGKLSAKRLVMDLVGANKVMLSGTAKTMVLAGAGYSNVQLNELVCDEAKVNLTGASRAQLHIQSKLSGEASGASQIRYTGAVTAIHMLTYGVSSVAKE